MWFLFSIISLVSFSIYFGIKRYQSNWVGIPGRVGNLVYSHHTIVAKEKTAAIFLGCTAANDIEFEVKKETGWDRFFKFVGISVELQVGRDSFDKTIYVLSHHPDVCSALESSEELQRQLEKIVSLCRDYTVNLKGLFIRNKRIWVQLAPVNKTMPPLISKMASDFIPLLHGISEGFAQKLPSRTSVLKDPFFWKASIILAISTGMAVTGGFHFFALSFTNIPFTIDTHELWGLSFLLGSIVVGIMVLATILFLGRTARTHLVILEVLSIGYFGAISSVACIARDMNIEFDTAQPQQYIVNIYDKSISRGRRHTSYYLHVDDWINKGYQRRLSVDSSMYHTFNRGDKLKVSQNPGFLGFRWVSDINGFYGAY